MNNNTQLGIYMEYTSARFLKIFNGDLKTETIHCNIKHQDKGEFTSRNEALTHYKAQQILNAFYKRIGLELIKYNEVLIFGATEAKNELFNLLERDYHYDQIKIEIATTEPLNDHEVKGFVKDYFSKNKVTICSHSHTIYN